MYCRNPFLITVMLIYLATGSHTTFANDFSYKSPGVLAKEAGTGRLDRQVYLPTLHFPLQVGPKHNNHHAYANSQIFPKSNGPTDSQNFDYPWTDTYCEKRSWNMPLCPGNVGHQGVDIRPNKKENNTYNAVAFDDGDVTAVTKNTTVRIRSSSTGDVCEYLHMDRNSITQAGIATGVKVKRGQVIGRVSNIMGGKPDTSIHLHFMCKQVIGGRRVYVPAYASLVAAYRNAWGLESSVVGNTLVVDPLREIDGSGIPVPKPTDQPDTTLPKTFQTKNYGAITPATEPSQWPEYLRKWPQRRIDLQIRDSNGHIIPAYISDEAGIGVWWYWVQKRAGLDPNGPVTFAVLAQKYAGSSSATAPENKVYIDCYSGTVAKPGVSKQYFGEWVDSSKVLMLAQKETRWKIAQTMFHCEAGRSMPFGIEDFQKGIAFAEKVIAEGFESIGPGGVGSTGPDSTPGTSSPVDPTPTGSAQSVEIVIGTVRIRMPLSATPAEIEKFLQSTKKFLAQQSRLAPKNLQDGANRLKGRRSTANTHRPLQQLRKCAERKTHLARMHCAFSG